MPPVESCVIPSPYDATPALHNLPFDTSCALLIILVLCQSINISHKANKLLAMSSKAMPPPSLQEML
jgi:hypothetical protein